MFLSDKVIFIHNPKVAGRSVRQALCNTYGGGRYGIGSSRFKIKYDHVHRVSVHSFASRVALHPRVRPLWGQAYKFGVVRNPWERAANMWFFCRNTFTPDGLSYFEHGLRLQHPTMPVSKVRHRCAVCVHRGFTYWLTDFCPKWKWSPWEYLGYDGDAGFFDSCQMDWFMNARGELLVDDLFLRS